MKMRQPEISHVVTVPQLRSCLDRVGKSPREQVEKNRFAVVGWDGGLGDSKRTIEA
jgi:hypothetical protein